jgi:release factor glutamine methyltransferase
VGSLADAVVRAARRLGDAGSPTPRLDAELLAGHLLGRDRTWIIAHGEAPIDGDAFDALIARRAAGEPVAYIRGYKEWHGLRLRTDRRALIPRPETELLADAAGDEVAERLRRDDGERSLVAWDLATGSGAVALVLARRFADTLRSGRLRLHATDLSPDALALARENLGDHGVADLVTLAEADLLAGAGSTAPRPDILVANLPYVPSAEVDRRRGSLGYEPRIALDGGEDGLVIIHRLMDQLPGALAPGGTVLLETGVDQAAAIRQVAPPGAELTVVPDLAGLDRVARLALP